MPSPDACPADVYRTRVGRWLQSGEVLLPWNLFRPGEQFCHCIPLAIRKENAMAKRPRRTDDPRPGFGRLFSLGDQKFWVVPDHMVDKWQGPYIAVAERLMLGAAQRIQAYEILGASREEAEAYALEWLRKQLDAEHFLNK